MYVIELTKEYEGKWTDFLNSNDKATLFHTLEWRDIIIESYGFKPYYYLLIDDGGNTQAIFPSFYIKSFLGNKLCSVPYNYYGGPLYKDQNAAKQILEYVIDKCKKLNVKYLEIKMFYPLEKSIIEDLNLKVIEDEYLSLINLSEGQEIVEKRFSRLVRRKLRQVSETSGVEIRDAKDIEDVKKFYNDVMVELYKKKLLTITQSFKLIELIWERLIKQNQGYLKLFTINDKIVAGVILLDSYNSLFDAWTLSHPDYFYMSPNYTLIFEGIKIGCLKNKKMYDLGVSGKNNQNLLDFKTRFGSVNIKFSYYYALIKAKNLKRIDYDTSFLSIRKFIKYMPTPLVKILSRILIKQFA